MLASDAKADPALARSVIEMYDYNEDVIPYLTDHFFMSAYNLAETDGTFVGHFTFNRYSYPGNTDETAFEAQTLSGIMLDLEHYYQGANLEWVQEPVQKTFGGTTGAYYVVTYDSLSTRAISYRFQVSREDTLYTFFYTTSAQFTGNSLDVLEYVFSSIDCW